MNDEDELFELKKASIQQSFDTKNYSGVYYNGIHGLEVNANNTTYPEAVISYIHESVHYIAHNVNFGIFQMDYLVLFLSLVYFSSKYKAKKIDEFFIQKKITDDEEKNRYIFVNNLEIDEYLAIDQKYVDFLKFCISIYDIFYYTIINSTFINESLATYLSLNINSSYYLYDTLMKDFFYDELVSEEIRKCQGINKKKIKNLEKSNIYSIGYKYAEELVNKFGIEETLGLGHFIFNYIPVYNFDLIGMSSVERANILNKYFNLDKKWRKVSDLNFSDIFMDNNFRDDAPLHICGYLLNDLPITKIESESIFLDNIFKNMPKKDLIPESVFHAYRRIYFHPHVMHEIEKLNESKTNYWEMKFARKFANQLIYDPKSTGVYNFVKDKDDIIIDERIKRFPELCHKSTYVYTYKLIQQIVSTMDTIILINKNNGR